MFSVFVLLAVSCKTYTVTPESFKSQFIKVDSRALKEMTINNPLGFQNIRYAANQVEQINVIDKHGQMVVLPNSPSIETRVTLKNGKRHYFYFDTLVLQNDTLIGSKSRFLSSIIQKLPFDSIEKIEIQNGGKKF